MLRSLDWWLVTDVSGQPIGPIGTDRKEDLIDIAAEARHHAIISFLSKKTVSVVPQM
jgi:hypothetical protein